jgi:large subunit ribosomal protein L24
MRIKTGDKVLVIKGRERGKSGVITAVDKVTNRVKIEGLNMIKRHVKKSARAGSGGGIVEAAGSINASNVMLVDPGTGKPTRLGSNFAGDKKSRITKKSNTVIEDVKK